MSVEKVLIELMDMAIWQQQRRDNRSTVHHLFRY